MVDCPCCNKRVSETQRAIECDICFRWFHLRCSLLSSKDYKYYSESNDLWLCDQCRSEIFPFHSVSTSELTKLHVFNSNSTCLCSNKIAKLNLDSLPCLDTISSINKMHQLSNLDADLHLPATSNFKYYSTHDFHHDIEIKNAFTSNSLSILHSNIRSLAANHDHLLNLLCELQHSFSIIGLSEIKFKVEQTPMLNLSIPGYNFVPQPSLSNAGGVGFFVQDKFKFHIRDDISISKTEYESLWIEIDSDNSRNILCGVYYRHPSSKLDIFLDDLESTLNKIHRENKYCIIMGDFNINLLNFETNSSTNTFLNTMNTLNFRDFG